MAPFHVQKNANSLYILAKGDPDLRKAIVKGCKPELIRCLCEIADNVFRGNLLLSSAQKQELTRHSCEAATVGQ